MKIYISSHNGSLNETGYTALSSICKDIGVSYNSAVRGKRIWKKDTSIVEIKEIEIVKIKR